MGKVEFEKIKRPRTIKLPFMLDHYPLEDNKENQISQFFENLKNGQLTTTKCKKCTKVSWPPRIVCPECLSTDLQWVDLGTEAELYAFTEVRIGAPLGFAQDIPFCVGLIKISGLLLSSRIDNATYNQLRIGDKVQLKIAELDDGRVFYRFSKPREK